jgi:4-hydroxy-tetrahydrodipicolinate reductase
MTIRVLVNGAFGRMGQITTKMITDYAEFELVGQTGREYDLKTSIQDARPDVVVDFTHPDAVYANTMIIIDAGARPVIGTSGLSKAQIDALQARCESLQLGGIIAPNFSIGAVLMMKVAAEVAKYLPHVEIIEMHHQGKADSPSATAMRSAEKIATVIGEPSASIPPTRENVPGARGALYQNIPIHSIRLPGLLAHETIVFGGIGETLSLRHDSLDRQCFMSGVRVACEKVMGLKRLVYGLDEIL